MWYRELQEALVLYTLQIKKILLYKSKRRPRSFVLMCTRSSSRIENMSSELKYIIMMATQFRTKLWGYTDEGDIEFFCNGLPFSSAAFVRRIDEAFLQNMASESKYPIWY